MGTRAIRRILHAEDIPRGTAHGCAAPGVLGPAHAPLKFAVACLTRAHKSCAVNHVSMSFSVVIWRKTLQLSSLVITRLVRSAS